MTVKPWTRIQPVRMRLWKMKHRPLGAKDVTWEVPKCKSESPLLQTYERTGFLFYQTRAMPSYADAQADRALRRTGPSSESNFPTKSDLADDNVPPLAVILEEFNDWLEAIPESQEVLRTYAYSRLRGALFLHDYGKSSFLFSYT